MSEPMTAEVLNALAAKASGLLDGGALGVGKARLLRLVALARDGLRYRELADAIEECPVGCDERLFMMGVIARDEEEKADATD